MKMELYPIPEQYLQIEDFELSRRVFLIGDIVHGVVSSSGVVVLEGTPLYQNQSWDHDHEVGYNKILPAIKDEMGRRWVHSRHVVLLDDLNVPDEYKDSRDISLLSYMRMYTDGIYFESEFMGEAEMLIKNLACRGIVRQEENRLVFSSGVGGNIPLTNGKGLPSCELLDSLFQSKKILRGCDATVIVHSTIFRKQQEQMRMLLREISGGNLPFDIINVFFRNGNLSQVVHSDKEGRENVYF